MFNCLFVCSFVCLFVCLFSPRTPIEGINGSLLPFTRDNTNTVGLLYLEFRPFGAPRRCLAASQILVPLT